LFQVHTEQTGAVDALAAAIDKEEANLVVNDSAALFEWWNADDGKVCA